jgi:hypothetical protein
VSARSFQTLREIAILGAMRDEIVTITDADGKTWTGPIIAVGRIDNWALFWGSLTGGFSLLFQSRKRVTVRANGGLHYGLPVEKK